MKRFILFTILAVFAFSGFSQVQFSDGAKGLKLDVSFAESALTGGSDEVTNGGFDSDTWWSKDASITITGGKAVYTSSADGDILYKTSLLTIGNYYQIYGEISDYSAGGLSFKAGSGAESPTYSANGKFSVLLKATTTQTLTFTAKGTTTLKLDNVACRQIDQATYERISGNSVTASNVRVAPDHKGGGAKYYSFDGTDDEINLGDNAQFEYSTAMAALVKVNHTDLAENQTLIAKYITTGDEREYRLQVLSTGKVQISLGDPSDGTLGCIWVTDDVVVTAGVDHVVGFTYSSSTITVYVDGVEKSGSIDTGAIPSSLWNGTADLLIGNVWASGTDEVYGKIYDAYLFNYDITDSIADWSTKIANNTFLLPEADQGADNVTNIVVNGTFEAGTASPPSSWSHNGNHTATAVADGTAPEGSNVCEVVATGSGLFGSNFFKQTPIALEEGQSYIVSYYAKKISGGDSIRFGFQGTADFVFDQTITTSWVRYSFQYDNTNAVSTSIVINSVDGAMTYRLDNVLITKCGSTLSLPSVWQKPTAWHDWYHDEIYTVDGPTMYRNSWSNALWFDGSTSLLTLSADHVINTSNSIVTFWAARASTGTAMTVLGNSGTGTYKYINFTDAGTIVLETDTDTDAVTGTLNDDDTDFHHYAIVFDGLAVTMYQDGVAMSISGSPVTDDLTVDQIGAAGTAVYFNGYLSAPDVYDKSVISMPIADWVTLHYDSTK